MRTWSTLKKLIWLRKGVMKAASWVWKTVTGSLLHITDAIAGDVSALSVSINPVQSLNGYDNPWPAGGRVNKFPNSLAETKTAGDITIKSNGDGTYTVSGTSTSSGRILFDLVDSYIIPTSIGRGGQGCLYLNNSFYGNGLAVQFYNNATQVDEWAITSANRTSSAYSAMAGKTVNKVGLSFPSGTTISGTFAVMFSEDGSTTATFSPYSNICPISGWTQAKVTRTGKNLLPKMVAGTYTNNGGTIVVDENGVATMSGTTTASGNVAIIPLSAPLVITQEMVDAGLYYHINNSVANANIAANLESSGVVSATSLAFSPVNRISGAFGAPSVGKRIDSIRFWISSGVTLSGTYAPSFEFSSAASDYEPYSGTTLTIDLDGTIYGGTLDVLTGVLTVNKGIVDLGSLSWEKFNGTQTAYFRASVPGIKPAATATSPDGILCSAYRPTGSTYVSYSAYPYSIGVTAMQTANYIYVQDLRWNNASDFKTNASGVMFVYPLKNPQTVQLTPAQLTLLAGENYVWCDTGDISLTYKAAEPSNKVGTAKVGTAKAG